jgi:hypothetical protein
MNIQELRQSLKFKWLSYYEQNCSWLVKIRVWGNYNGVRRPSSGFILATLSVLEPQFDEVISFVVSLNNNPDEIVTALGLDFNPDEELSLINLEDFVCASNWQGEFLPENHEESEDLPLVATASEFMGGETLKSESESCALPRLSQSVSSVAVATRPTTKMVDSPKLPAALLLEDKPLRSPLAITINVCHKNQTLPSRIVKHPRLYHVPIKFCCLLLQKNCLIGILFLHNSLKSSVPSNGNGKITPQPQDITPPMNLPRSQNASSLASWVDESCQGREYDREAAIAR